MSSIRGIVPVIDGLYEFRSRSIREGRDAPMELGYCSMSDRISTAGGFLVVMLCNKVIAIIHYEIELVQHLSIGGLPTQ